VEIIVTLKDAKGCSVLQFPHAVWMVSSSNAGSAQTGSDDQAKTERTQTAFQVAIGLLCLL
jgi:hypothetical protein